MLRGALRNAGSALRALTPRREEVKHGRLIAPSISELRLRAAPAWRRRSSSRKNPTIASPASSSSSEAGRDDGDAAAPSSPPPPPPPLASNPFYSFMPSTPASRAAAASGTSLAPAPRPARVCRRCDGRGDVECAPCAGLGSLPRGGYSRRNALNSSKAVGTTWTALQRTLGRTHFDCRGKRVVGGPGAGGAGAAAASSGGAEERGEGDSEGEGETKEEEEEERKRKKRKRKKKRGGQTYYLMVATCDDEIRLWVPGTTLKDRGAWAAGWLARGDLDALRREVNGGGGGGGAAAEEGKCGDGGGSSGGGEREGGGEGGGTGPPPPSRGPRGASCKKCEGTGRVPCPLCSRAGEMIHV